MKPELNSSKLSVFKSFVVKNTKAIKGGDDPIPPGIIGGDEIGDG